MTTEASGLRTAVIAPIRLPDALAAFRDGNDPIAEIGVPAHVTILFPFVPAAELAPAIRHQLRAVARSTPAFVATFDRAERHQGLVWVRPADERPFLRLTAETFERWPSHPPYEGIHDDLIAHLTVLESDDPAALDRAVRVAKGVLPFDAPVHELELIEENEDGRFHHRWSIPLPGPANVTSAGRSRRGRRC